MKQLFKSLRGKSNARRRGGAHPRQTGELATNTIAALLWPSLSSAVDRCVSTLSSPASLQACSTTWRTSSTPTGDRRGAAWRLLPG
jgi:hypothetical protein